MGLFSDGVMPACSHFFEYELDVSKIAVSYVRLWNVRNCIVCVGKKYTTNKPHQISAPGKPPIAAKHSKVFASEWECGVNRVQIKL